MKISVEVRNMDKVQDALNTIQKGLREKAIGPALNRAAEKARAELARAIPEEYAVRAAEVRNAVSLRKARSGNLEATITVFGSTSRRGRSMNLIHFLSAVQQAGKAMKTRGAKASKADLSALNRQLGFLIKRGGGLKKIDGAFVGNHGRTIFRRIGKARLPIEPLQVIGFSQMFSSRKISTRIMTKIESDLLIEINRSIARLMGNRST
ncbi:MAG: phage tail protein [Candidatus Accumulibacter sp.]|uniref:phage tail protein n=1 Tax=Accumulibacter sp. TaxID=2053492 RepID=UPI002582DFB6|nr:phage tail protein [Accumulibacter sp.]MBK8113599.1 phage tail protein [Accumulibacter sp.]